MLLYHRRTTGPVDFITSFALAVAPAVASVVPLAPAVTSAASFVVVARVFVLTAAFVADVAAALFFVVARPHHCVATFAFPAGAAPPCADALGPASVGASEGFAGPSCRPEGLPFEWDFRAATQAAGWMAPDLVRPRSWLADPVFPGE
jgi:hypothetical protein